MDWTIFWTIFRPFFLDHFIGGKHTISTKGGVGCNLSVYEGRAGRQCYYSGRGERRTMTTQGGVGGGCNRKRYWLMERLLDHTN